MFLLVPPPFTIIETFYLTILSKYVLLNYFIKLFYPLTVLIPDLTTSIDEQATAKAIKLSVSNNLSSL